MYLLKLITVLLYILRQYYVRIKEKAADSQKPKTKAFSKHNFGRYIAYGLEVVIVFQLLGLPLFPMNLSSSVILIGFILVILGYSIVILGMKHLGTNWAHASEYQIKKGQTLISVGIYRYIRNPIYIGLLLFYVGGELVAESYLFLFFVVVFSLPSCSVDR